MVKPDIVSIHRLLAWSSPRRDSLGVLAKGGLSGSRGTVVEILRPVVGAGVRVARCGPGFEITSRCASAWWRRPGHGEARAGTRKLLLRLLEGPPAGAGRPATTLS